MALMPGLKVEILTNGRALPMYDDPDVLDHSPDSHTQYIEATTGAKFMVRVTVQDGFAWGDCHLVRITAFFDGDSGWVRDIRAQKAVAKFSTVSRWCQASSQWKSGTLGFGSLEMKEATDIVPDFSRLSDLGKIRITGQRFYYSVHQPPTTQTNHKDSRISEVSEKVLKGKAISHTVE
ncbi:MAG: hypothetical protein Q9195_002605 [Heterodermia aff. obscurata]